MATAIDGFSHRGFSGTEIDIAKAFDNVSLAHQGVAPSVIQFRSQVWSGLRFCCTLSSPFYLVRGVQIRTVTRCPLASLLALEVLFSGEHATSEEVSCCARQDCVWAFACQVRGRRVYPMSGCEKTHPRDLWGARSRARSGTDLPPCFKPGREREKERERKSE